MILIMIPVMTSSKAMMTTFLMRILMTKSKQPPQCKSGMNYEKAPCLFNYDANKVIEQEMQEKVPLKI